MAQKMVNTPEIGQYRTVTHPHVHRVQKCTAQRRLAGEQYKFHNELVFIIIYKFHTAYRLFLDKVFD